MTAVYWLTGLSGCGKTTIGKVLYQKLRQNQPAVVLLDGDVLREVLGQQTQYQVADRYEISMIYARLCKMLSEQGITVVCCTISLFHATQVWNREHIPYYYEILIQTPLQELRQRDSKQIYSQQQQGQLSDVVGVDLTAEFPKLPDLIIENTHGKDIEQQVEKILDLSIRCHDKI